MSERHGSTIVITHHYADLDALASMVGAARLYGGTPVKGRAINPMVRSYLALHKDHFPLVPFDKIDPARVERVVVVDVRDRRRLAEYEPIFAAGPEIIVYDHHPASPHDLESDETYVEPTGSCATMMVERIQGSDEDLGMTTAEATLLLLGIYSDTGRLSFDITTPRDVDAAAWLLRHGASLAVVNRYLQEEFTLEQRQLLVELMETCEEESIEAVEVAYAQASAPRFVSGASTVVFRVMQMGGHDAIFAILHFVKDKRVQVIARSRVPYVDVGALMQQLGGGGHAGAAAATFKKADPEEVRERVAALVRGTSLRPTRVADMMTTPVQTIAHTATFEDADRLLSERGVKGLPVLKNERLCGIISIRDVERARGKVEPKNPVSSFMTHEVITIAPDEPLEDAAALMTERDIGRLPVVVDGRMIGIVSRTDMLAMLYDE